MPCSREPPARRSLSASGRPSCRCSTRSAIAAALAARGSRSRPRGRAGSRSSSSTAAPLSWSRLPVGSSASTSSGSLTSARAIASRCCSPPESSCGRPIRDAARARAPRSAARRAARPVPGARQARGQQHVLLSGELLDQVKRLEHEADVAEPQCAPELRGGWSVRRCRPARSGPQSGRSSAPSR